MQKLLISWHRYTGAPGRVAHEHARGPLLARARAAKMIQEPHSSRIREVAQDITRLCLSVLCSCATLAVSLSNVEYR